MPFTVEPKSGPTIQALPTAQSSEQTSAKERAIARLLSNSEHTLPPTNQTKPTPEDTSALTTQSVDQSDLSRLNNTTEGQTTSAEASKPEETKAAPTEPEKPLSSEYAILARKEKALRARDQQLRTREAAIKASEDAKAASLNPKPTFDESKYISKDRLQQDLFGTLSELGLTYDQITSQAVNAPTPEQVAMNQQFKALQDEIKALRGEQDTTKKSWEQQQQDSYKQAVTQIRHEATSLVTHDPNFETIKETGSIDDVVDLIERTFKEDGTLLTVEEAAQQVEDYLVEEALKIARIKKIQQRLQPVSTPAETKPTGQPQQQQMKTLTNQVSSTRQLTTRERAILAAQGKLQK